MNDFVKKIEVRWADLDPNFHVVHSKYYDFGAYCRMAFLVENGLTPQFMQQHNIGPILFREECVFKREVLFGDEITINVKLDKLTADFGRWTMVHEIYKNGETLAAVITADGAWLNTSIRKLTVPPAVVIALFESAPKTVAFKMF
ncbi:MAG: acyl-CoA thioesterase [Ferruginibacter sp.]